MGYPIKRSFWNVESTAIIECGIAIIMVVFVLSDAANAYYYFVTNTYQKISIIPRSVFELFIILFIVSRKKITRTSLYLIIICLGLAGIFFIGFGTYQANRPDAGWGIALQHFNKHIYMFLCFIVMWEFRKKIGDLKFNKIFMLYEIVIYCNAIAIFCGVVFNIHWMSSYGGMNGSVFETDRFGYKGLIPAVNEASLFWVTALFYGLVVLLNERKKALLIVSSICCVLVGTKGAILFGIATFTLFGLCYYPKKTIVICTSLFIVGTIFVALNYARLVELVRSLKVFSFYVYQSDSGYNLFSILLTGRDTFISRAIENVTNYWGLVNYLFGGQDRMAYLIEMDFFDTVLFFGFLGTVLYLFGFIVIFRKMQKGFRGIFVVVFLSMAFFGGHVFWSAVNSIYIALLVIRAVPVKKVEIGVGHFGS